MPDRCVKSVTVESFDAEVLRHPGVVLIDFYTHWCPPCKKVAPVLEELCGERQRTLKIVKVGVEANAAIADGISSLPTSQLYRDGEKIGQVTGYQSKAQFVQWIESAAG